VSDSPNTRIRPQAAAFILAVSFMGDTSADVKLRDRDDTVRMDNGLVSVVVRKADATLLSIKKNGIELLMAPDRRGRGKGYIQRHPQSGYSIPKIDKFQVHLRTPDTVDLSFHQDNDDYPFVFDVHYVMRAGVSGFYNYIILRYDKHKVASYVAGWQPRRPKESRVKLDANAFALGQCNLCLRMNTQVFTHTAVSDTRQHLLVTEEMLKQSKKIMDATYRLKDGRIYSKYDMAVRMDRHRLHGIMGNGFGAWIIQGNGEHLNGGPYSQELTAHYGILLRHFSASHFGSTTPVLTPEDHGWAKLGGPWLVYINTAANNEELWANAKRQADQYLAQWPCKWLKHPLYPITRGTVRGKLAITDGTDPAGSLIILAQPPGGRIPEWQQQGRGFIFWSWVQGDGSFEIGRARPGTYSLYALNDSQMGELRRDGVKVATGGTTKVGTLTWKPDVRGKILWQVGVPDRTSQEFRRGGEPRQYGRWLKYPTDFPNDVTFEIGRSRERTDWNYVHVPHYKNGKWHLPTWKIVFDCGQAYSGKAYLRVGAAGMDLHKRSPDAWVGATLKLNAADIGTCQFRGHDSSTARGGTQGRYREQLVEFDATLLKPGRNVLEMTLAATFTFRGRPPASYPYVALQYDCIRLEVNEHAKP